MAVEQGVLLHLRDPLAAATMIGELVPQGGSVGKRGFGHADHWHLNDLAYFSQPSIIETADDPGQAAFTFGLLEQAQQRPQGLVLVSVVLKVGRALFKRANDWLELRGTDCLDQLYGVLIEARAANRIGIQDLFHHATSLPWRLTGGFPGRPCGLLQGAAPGSPSAPA